MSEVVRLCVGLAMHKPVVFELSPGGTTIGRDGADIVMASGALSRCHARFVRLDRIVTVEDLDSTNGTWKDGGRIMGRVRLEPGDLVAMGNVVAALHDGTPTDHGHVTLIAALTGEVGARRVRVPLPLRIRWSPDAGTSGCTLQVWRGPLGGVFWRAEEGGDRSISHRSLALNGSVLRWLPDNIIVVGPFTIRCEDTNDGDARASTIAVPGGWLAIMPVDTELVER